MTFSQIAYEAHGPIRVIRFNRPDKRNCIGPTTHLELVEAWTRFRDAPNALVAIITGTGDKPVAVLVAAEDFVSSEELGERE